MENHENATLRELAKKEMTLDAENKALQLASEERIEREKTRINWRHIFFFPYVILMFISYLIGVVMLSFIAFFEYIGQNEDSSENFKESEKEIRKIFKSIFN